MSLYPRRTMFRAAKALPLTSLLLSSDAERSMQSNSHSASPTQSSITSAARTVSTGTTTPGSSPPAPLVSTTDSTSLRTRTTSTQMLVQVAGQPDTQAMLQRSTVSVATRPRAWTRAPALLEQIRCSTLRGGGPALLMQRSALGSSGARIG